jgi:ferredoxin
MYRISIDQQLCSGFGSCAETAPAVFALDNSGTVTLLRPESDEENVVEAARSCPMGAIAVFDASSGDQVV